MTYLIHCRNSKCKFYFEDGCFNNQVKTIVLDENGLCETFVEGTHELYKLTGGTMDECDGENEKDWGR